MTKKKPDYMLSVLNAKSKMGRHCGEYLPSLEEIERVKTEIRKTWDKKTYVARGDSDESVSVGEHKCHIDIPVD